MSKNGKSPNGHPSDGDRRDAAHIGDSLVVQSRMALAKVAVIEAFTGKVEGVFAGIITDAVEHAGVHRSTFYLWLKDDEDFRALFEHAQETAADLLEREARRRAVDGVVRPLVSMGRIVMEKVQVIEDGVVKWIEQPMTIREYDSRLLELLLTGRRGAVFGRRKVDVGVSGQLGLVVSKPEEVPAAFVADVLRELNQAGEPTAGAAPAE